ncbi:MAG: prokaryotic E2 ligase family D protein [Tolypothrix carrinoi HA7290-LM1]|jgi:PRTRC genetic system protein B|nr:prokaryotic E2 ligase family D protein [Tolypothrix carrinoi HA7290-LM1]
MEHIITAEIIRELLQDPPRSLSAIKAELLILDGTYILHYQSGEKSHYKCLSPTALRIAFSNEPIDSGWIGEGVVRTCTSNSGEWVVKFVPPQRTLLDCDELGQVQIPMPAMIFVGKNFTYWLWATKIKIFDPDASLFHAPLPNVYTPWGKVCWGKNQPPSASAQSINQAWNLFISSPFNSHLSNGKSKHHTNDVRDQLLALHQQKNCTYPLKDLVPLDKKATIATLFSEIADDSAS